MILASLDSPASLEAIVEGFLGQGHGSRAKVTWLKVSLKLMIFGRWAHINVKLHFLFHVLLLIVLCRGYFIGSVFSREN